MIDLATEHALKGAGCHLEQSRLTCVIKLQHVYFARCVNIHFVESNNVYGFFYM